MLVALINIDESCFPTPNNFILKMYTIVWDKNERKKNTWLEVIKCDVSLHRLVLIVENNKQQPKTSTQRHTFAQMHTNGWRTKAREWAKKKSALRRRVSGKSWMQIVQGLVVVFSAVLNDDERERERAHNATFASFYSYYFLTHSQYDAMAAGCLSQKCVRNKQSKRLFTTMNTKKMTVSCALLSFARKKNTHIRWWQRKRQKVFTQDARFCWMSLEQHRRRKKTHHKTR